MQRLGLELQGAPTAAAAAATAAGRDVRAQPRARGDARYQLLGAEALGGEQRAPRRVGVDQRGGRLDDGVERREVLGGGIGFGKEWEREGGGRSEA